MADATGPAEFSRAVNLRELPPKGRAFDLKPDEKERAAIARRLGVPSVELLAGRVEIKPTSEGARLKGAFAARLERRCVVTLEPMTEEIDETLDLRFVRDVATDADETDLEVLVDEDSPEPLDGDMIDIGEVLVQHLALAMSPYPRREDASFEASEFGESGESSPFAVLKGAIAKRGGEE